MRSDQHRKLLPAALLAISLSALFACTAVEAAAPGPAACSLGEYQPSARPDAAGTATTVSLGLLLADLIAISDTDQTVTLNVLLTMEWTDHRLSPVAGCHYSGADIWTPDIQLTNSGSLASRQPAELMIQDGGRVVTRVRFEGTVSNPWHMKRFPFDSNDILLQLVSLRYSAAEVSFLVNESWTGRRSVMTVPNWDIGKPTASVNSIMMPLLGHEASFFSFEIPASRLADYYIFKFFFPLCLIVMMSWAVFWISPDHLGAQISLSGTSMLTLIAYQFTINDLLPKVGYLTIMDKFVLVSSILVFLALVEAITSGAMAHAGNIKAAERLDRISRWLFPGAYAIIVLATLLS